MTNVNLCPKCGATLAPDAAFCGNCGVTTGVPAAAAPPPQFEAPPPQFEPPPPQFEPPPPRFEPPPPQFEPTPSPVQPPDQRFAASSPDPTIPISVQPDPVVLPPPPPPGPPAGGGSGKTIAIGAVIFIGMGVLGAAGYYAYTHYSHRKPAADTNL